MVKKTERKTRRVATAEKIDPKDSCTIREAAEMLGIKHRTALNFVRKGTLKSFTYGKGMKPRVLLSSVRELLNKIGA